MSLDLSHNSLSKSKRTRRRRNYHYIYFKNREFIQNICSNQVELGQTILFKIDKKWLKLNDKLTDKCPLKLLYNDYIINECIINVNINVNLRIQLTEKRRWLFEMASVDRRSQRRKIFNYFYCRKAAWKRLHNCCKKVTTKCALLFSWGRDRGRGVGFCACVRLCVWGVDEI